MQLITVAKMRYTACMSTNIESRSLRSTENVTYIPVSIRDRSIYVFILSASGYWCAQNRSYVHIGLQCQYPLQGIYTETSYNWAYPS